MQIVCNTIEMDYCYDRHEHKYLITYRTPNPGAFSPQWKVCDYCYENKKCFNNLEEIKSIVVIA